MRTKKYTTKYKFSEDRISVLILSSLFVAVIGATGCSQTATMHLANGNTVVERDVFSNQSNGVDGNEVAEDVKNEEDTITGIGAKEQKDYFLEDTNAIESITVHICGEVLNPGVYELEKGSRIIDVVQLSGGFTPEAASDAVNLAALMQDCDRIYIPNIEETAASHSENGIYTGTNAGTAGTDKEAGNASDATNKDSRININTADVNMLQTITGIGETRAKAIIQYRESAGGFKRIEDIKNVSGIGEASFEKMKDMITVN